MRPRVALLGAVLSALLGVGLSVVVGGSAAAYALTLTPLAVGLGAAGGVPADRSTRLLGATVGLGTAIVVAAVLAVIRLRYAGATGVPGPATLARSRELQMVVGLIPGILGFGAGLAGRGMIRSALGGAAAAVVMGPVLIGLTLLAAVPVLRPPVPGLVTLAVVALVAWRRR